MFKENTENYNVKDYSSPQITDLMQTKTQSTS